MLAVNVGYNVQVVSCIQVTSLDYAVCDATVYVCHAYSLSAMVALGWQRPRRSTCDRDCSCDDEVLSLPRVSINCPAYQQHHLVITIFPAHSWCDGGWCLCCAQL